MASSGHTTDSVDGDGSIAVLDRLRVEVEAAPVPVEWSPRPGFGPVLGELVLTVAPDPPGREQAAFAVEAVLEGFLCHQGHPRLFRIGDGDLALLTGDLLYALGLRAVATARETDSVRLLADLIGVGAGLASEGRSEALVALWAAQTVALGESGTSGWEGPLAGLSAGMDRDGARLLGEASERASLAGADGAFGRAVEALQSEFETAVGAR